MPFSAAFDTMFLGPMGCDAVFTPRNGAPLPDPVRVILSQPDTFTPVFDVQVASATTQVEVRVSEVSALGNGDMFALADGSVLTVNGKPKRDDLRLIWIASAVEG